MPHSSALSWMQLHTEFHFSFSFFIQSRFTPFLKNGNKVRSESKVFFFLHSNIHANDSTRILQYEIQVVLIGNRRHTHTNNTANRKPFGSINVKAWSGLVAVLFWCTCITLYLCCLCCNRTMTHETNRCIFTIGMHFQCKLEWNGWQALFRQNVTSRCYSGVTCKQPYSLVLVSSPACASMWIHTGFFVQHPKNGWYFNSIFTFNGKLFA